MPPDCEEGPKVWCLEVVEVVVVDVVVGVGCVWREGLRRQLLCWWRFGRVVSE